MSAIGERSPEAEHGWQGLRRAGAVVAFVGLAAMALDVALAMVWGPGTVPTSAPGWLAQGASEPALCARNLDLLNVAVAVVLLPMYLALLVALRREAPASAAAGVALVALGTALFAGANAALPMLDLARQHALAATDDERRAIEAAAVALLSRGRHGSLGAFPGFLVSEAGTLLVCVAMLGSRAFGRVAAWLGIGGTVALMLYSATVTFVPAAAGWMMALAAPGGLAMIAWHALVGRGLWRLSREARAG